MRTCGFMWTKIVLPANDSKLTEVASTNCNTRFMVEVSVKSNLLRMHMLVILIPFRGTSCQLFDSAKNILFAWNLRQQLVLERSEYWLLPMHLKVYLFICNNNCHFRRLRNSETWSVDHKQLHDYLCM